MRVAKPAAKRCRSGTGLRNGRIVRDPALHKGEGLGEYESTYVPMHHIHPRCLDRTAPHLMLPCDLQMSGTGLGPSAATISKWPKRKKHDWLNKENLRKQREATACAAQDADPAAGARNPGLCAFTF